MKTLKSLTVIALLSLTYVAKAQDPTIDDNRDKMHIGIKGGANLSNVYDTKGQDFVANSLIGGILGGFISVPLGTYFGVQGEILFSQKGFSASGVTPEGPYSYKNRSNFLDVPIMFQFKPATNIYILGGPEYSYLLSQTNSFNSGVTSESIQQEFQNVNIRHNIFGVIFGLDVNFGHLIIGGRVAWDLMDNNVDGASTLPRYRNVWGQLTLGLQL